jgi:hypothetical protein
MEALWGKGTISLVVSRFCVESQYLVMLRPSVYSAFNCKCSSRLIGPVRRSHDADKTVIILRVANLVAGNAKRSHGGAYGGPGKVWVWRESGFRRSVLC